MNPTATVEFHQRVGRAAVDELQERIEDIRTRAEEMQAYVLDTAEQAAESVGA